MNKNARIVSNDYGKFYVTETRGRDDGFHACVTRFNNTSNTELNLQTGVQDVTLTGSQARTIYRLLKKHYEHVG